MYAELHSEDIDDFVEKLIRGLGELGFEASRRAEGYALMPKGVNVPTHLRIGVYGNAVTLWVRGAESVVSSASKLGMSSEEFFELVRSGVMRAAEIFNTLAERTRIRVIIPGME